MVPPSASRRGALSLLGSAVLGGCSALLGDSEPTERSPTTGQQPVRLGVFAPDPDTFPPGRAIAEGARLGAEAVNRTGGLAGRPLEPVVLDTAASPQVASGAYTERVSGGDVGPTVGGYLTPVVRELAEHVGSSSVHLTTGASGPGLARLVGERYDDYRGLFRAGPPNTATLVEPLSRFVAGQADAAGWERVATLVTDRPWFAPFGEHLADRLRDHVEVVETVEQSGTCGTTYAGLFDEVAEAGADALVAVADTCASKLVRDWGDQRPPFALGGYLPPVARPSFGASVDGYAAGAFTLVPAAVPARPDHPPPFVAAYRDRFGRAPAPEAAYAYDAVRILRVAAPNDGMPVGELIDRLERVTLEDSAAYRRLAFQGPDSRFPHDPAPDLGAGVPRVVQWQDGAPVPVHPAGAAGGEYRRPPWR
jgi:branched-chain amino acid transport system substrate-binding protein